MYNLKDVQLRLTTMLRYLPDGFDAYEFISVGDDGEVIKLYLGVPARLAYSRKPSLSHGPVSRWGAWKDALQHHFGDDTPNVLAWGPPSDDYERVTARQNWHNLTQALKSWR